MSNKTGNYRWTIVALLFFATTINYIDRQVIGILKPFISEDLGWSENDYGHLLIAFAAAGHQGWASNIFSIVSDIYPNKAVGSMMGLSGFAGAVGGALSASFVGLILEATNSYFVIFAIASAMYLLNWLILKIFIPEIKPIQI